MFRCPGWSAPDFDHPGQRGATVNLASLLHQDDPCVRILLACYLCLKRAKLFCDMSLKALLKPCCSNSLSLSSRKSSLFIFCHAPASLLTQVPYSKALFVTAEERCYSLDLPFGFLQLCYPSLHWCLAGVLIQLKIFVP